MVNEGYKMVITNESRKVEPIYKIKDRPKRVLQYEKPPKKKDKKKTNILAQEYKVGIEIASLYPLVILGAIFLGVVKLMVIVSQMHSAIKVLEDKVKVLFEMHNKAEEEQNVWKQEQMVSIIADAIKTKANGS